MRQQKAHGKRHSAPVPSHASSTETWRRGRNKGGLGTALGAHMNGTKWDALPLRRSTANGLPSEVSEQPSGPASPGPLRHLAGTSPHAPKK